MNELDHILQLVRANNPGIFDSPNRDHTLVTVTLVEQSSNQTPPLTQGDLLLPQVNGRTYWGVYVTSSEYLVDGPETAATEIHRAVVAEVLAKVDQEALLIALRNLDAALGNPESEAEIQAFLEASLTDPSRARLRAVLAQENRALYSSQGVLAAFRRVILEGRRIEETKIDPRFGAILLVQSVLNGDCDVNSTGRILGGFPEETAMSIIANHEFNATTNIYAEFDRTLRIFEDKNGKVADQLGGYSPRELVKLSTGLELEELQSCAMVLWANDLGKDLWAPRGLNKRVNEVIDEDIVSQFWKICSRDNNSLAPLLSSQLSEWDYFGFEKFPVINFEHYVLLVSRTLIMARVTTGLYHFVYEYLETKNPTLKSKWESVWGSMVEEAIEQSLRTLAPAALGRGSCYFTEDEIGVAYPHQKKCDALIDFGHTVLAIEIVSSPLSRASRQGLNADALRGDMERIVFKKLRQLSTTAVNVAQNPSSILGAARTSVRIKPLLITGGGFPVNPITVNLVNEKIVDEGLFAHHLIDTMTIISPEELEYLEALAEQGYAPLDLLAEWQASGTVTGNFTFKNWLKGDGRFTNLRPNRMNAPVQKLFDSMKSFQGDK